MSVSVTLGVNDDVKIDHSITSHESMNIVKNILSPGEAYVHEVRPEGDDVVVFSDHFVEAYKKALTNNCVNAMTRKEKKLYFGFVKWNSGIQDTNINTRDIDSIVYKALDEWTTRELLGQTHPDYTTCGD